VGSARGERHPIRRLDVSFHSGAPPARVGPVVVRDEGGNPAKVKVFSYGTPPMSHGGAFDERIDLENPGQGVARTAIFARSPECRNCYVPNGAVQAREEVIVTSRVC